MKLSLSLVTVFATCCSYADGDWEKVPLRFEKGCSLETIGNMVRLPRAYRQEGNLPVMIEAEEASSVELDNLSRRIVLDKDASNGAYMNYVKYLKFVIDIKTPGKYNSRILGYFPKSGNWMHYEQMDNGGKLGVWDSRNGIAGVWLWTEGQEYDLDKGKHIYLFPSPTAFCGGSRIDKLVLMPVGSKLDPGSVKPAVQTMPDSAEAVSRKLRLDRINAWKLDYHTELNSGKAAVEYSYDRKKWEVVISAKEYVVSSPKPDYLWLRFKLAAAKGKGRSPWIQGVSMYIKKDKTKSTQRRNDYEQIN